MLQDLVVAFQAFDPSETGYITVDDFRRCITRLGDTLPESEFQQMLQVQGVDQSSNLVDYRTWVRTLLAQ